MVAKGKYKRASNQSFLPSLIESLLLKFLVEYNPSLVSFEQYTKTRVKCFGSSSHHGVPEEQKLRKLSETVWNIIIEIQLISEKKMIERNYTTNRAIKFELPNTLQQVPELIVRRQGKKKAPKMSSPTP